MDMALLPLGHLVGRWDFGNPSRPGSVMGILVVLELPFGLA